MDVKETTHNDSGRDDLSEVVSIKSKTPSLQDETLPSYKDVQPSSAASPAVPEKTGQPLGPTISSPFAFPPAEPSPSYEPDGSVLKPMAIPQISPTQAAPLLSAYPPELLKYGIPKQSWYSFVDTVSAFLSATVSQQAVHHATEVAQSMKNYHKNYAAGVVSQVKGIGKEAKRFNVFGMVGISLGLVAMSVGHAVGTVITTPLAPLFKGKPKTPKERATVYITTANRDWFSSRGLYALLVSTDELAAVTGTSTDSLMAAVRDEKGGDAANQLAALRQWIGDVEIREPVPTTDGPAAEPAQLRKAAAKEASRGPFQLSRETQWMVVIREEKAMEILNAAEANAASGPRRR